VSRYNPHHNIDDLLSAANLWRTRCLLSGGSLFGTEAMWTKANADLIAARFDNAGQVVGATSFLSQLEMQLSGLPAGALQLAAEMIWVLDLFPSDIAPQTKRDRMGKVLAWSGVPLPDHSEFVKNEVLVGIGKPGMGYRTNLWREFLFLAKFVSLLKDKPDAEQKTVTSDPWIFVDLLEAVSPGEKRQLKHILPYLLFPDNFESIASGANKRAILNKIDGSSNAEIRALTRSELDKRLLNLRGRLEAEAGGPIEYYASPLRELWMAETPTPVPAEDAVTDEAPSLAAPTGAFASDRTRFPSEPLNLILYGPPGTGKTYSVVERAVRTIDPAFHARHQRDWSSLKARFDELKNSGEVVFVTFHQSYSYEDFVEGIRAKTDENGSIRYEVTDGVFKRLCAASLFQPGERFRDYEVMTQTSELLWLRKPNGSELPIALRTLQDLAAHCRAGEITIDDIAQRNAIDKLPGTTLEKSLINGYNNILPALVERLMAREDTSRADSRRKVLIIDEINRGNVSKIFGELITLLEDTKRTGAPEAMSVTLPYSRTEFSIPNTIHLIGTMNTSDRSLTGLDLALRRRFAFEELEPNAELLDEYTVEGVNIGDLLEAMNERIELLAGREFRIGHAWFMQLGDRSSLDELRRIFQRQIIPYLQEVFFEDWGRLRMVLNDHMKKSDADQFVVAATKSSEDILGDSGVSPVRGWTLNPDAFGRASAYQLVVGRAT
jgi:5-methylcytosine-specific restriction protein B